MITGKYRERIVAVFITVALMTTSMPANAGWLMRDRNGTATYLANGKVKSVYDSEGVSLSHIIDAEKGLITMINPDNKIYGSGTPEDFCNALKSLGDNMMDQLMAGLSPEQRKIMKEQMKQQGELLKSMPKPDNNMKSSVAVKKAKEGVVIASHKTDKYTLTVDGEKYADIWITSEILVEKEERELNLDKIYNMQKRMDRCMDSSGQEFGALNDPLDSPEYKKITEQGLVMREVLYMDGGGPGEAETSTDIISLEKKKIPGSEFDIPSGYRKVPIGDFLTGMTQKQ